MRGNVVSVLCVGQRVVVCHGPRMMLAILGQKIRTWAALPASRLREMAQGYDTCHRVHGEMIFSLQRHFLLKESIFSF